MFSLKNVKMKPKLTPLVILIVLSVYLSRDFLISSFSSKLEAVQELKEGQ